MVAGNNIGRAGIILILLFTTCKCLHGQNSPYDPELSDQAALIREQVDACTDRSLYIAGETIRFRANIYSAGLPVGREWSRVLYVELISGSGEAEAQGKYRVHHQVSAGGLEVPSSILTGNYFLKCYTRWMRNRDPEDFCYVPLRIINPARPDLSMEGGTGMLKEDLSTSSSGEGEVELMASSSIYGSGDTVVIELAVSGENSAGFAEGCLTAVPVEVRPGGQLQMGVRPGGQLQMGVRPGGLLQVEGNRKEESDGFRLQYLPDLNGATLSGSVINREHRDQSLDGTGVHITLMGDQSGYIFARSDAYGRFSVTLPDREGNLDLLVQPEGSGDETLEVRIDQDFDQRGISLPAGVFRLSESEKKVVTAMSRKVQLRDIYYPVDSASVSGERVEQVTFYGIPPFSLKMDDYVLLPTLEEVFINLVPDVTPVTRKNRNYFYISGENPGLSMFDPLIMIDQVPFFDMERFFAVSTDRISRIDVVNDVYLKGDQRYGGIINLRSREGDMAGIDLPENSFFIDFTAIYPPPVTRLEMASGNAHLPDTRNTLLWIPEFRVEADAPANILFIAPDYPGEYIVLFRGRDGMGEPVTSETRFIVK